MSLSLRSTFHRCNGVVRLICYGKQAYCTFPEVTKRIFSGIQPTGIPHIGNYLGAISHWVKLQNEGDGNVIFSIVDQHAITVPYNPSELKKSILDMAACLLASGIDPQRSILFQQSSVHYHTDLAWIFGSLITLPQLQHLPQWKEKSNMRKEVHLGIFTYPVLQSADILLYRATDVPVGEDQLQHIEITRHLARLFNSSYKTKFFPQPKAIISDFKRIKSLRIVNNKMSKSEGTNKGRIELTDSPDEIRNKIQKAVTDTNSQILYDPENRPGVSNLIDIYCAFTDLTPEEVMGKIYSMNKAQFKSLLSDTIIETLSPVREEVIRLQTDYSHIENVLKRGAESANVIAEENYKIIKKIIGFC